MTNGHTTPDGGARAAGSHGEATVGVMATTIEDVSCTDLMALQEFLGSAIGRRLERWDAAARAVQSELVRRCNQFAVGEGY